MHDQYDIMVNIKCDQHTKKSPIIILLNGYKLIIKKKKYVDNISGDLPRIVYWRRPSQLFFIFVCLFSNLFNFKGKLIPYSNFPIGNNVTINVYE